MKQPAKAQSVEAAPELLGASNWRRPDVAWLLTARSGDDHLAWGVSSRPAMAQRGFLAPGSGDYVVVVGGRSMTVHLNAGEVKRQ